MLKENPEFAMPYDRINPTYRFDRTFEVLFPNREEWRSNSVIFQQNSQVWFTDGSKMNEYTGVGIYCPQTQKSLSLPLGRYPTVFQSETFGILSCTANHLLDIPDNIPIFICSDSQSARRALKGNKFNSSLVLEFRDALQSLLLTNQVTLIWVPGHCGINGNETADNLARIGSNSTYIGAEPLIKVSSSVFKHFIEHWKRNTFKNHWRSTKNSNQAKMCISYK